MTTSTQTRIGPLTRRTAVMLAASVAAGPLLSACSIVGAGDGGGSDDVVVVGYQSKTINTVTAGTLLRERGYLEKELAALGKRTGKTYRVSWEDYATGAPITAQMIAGKIDIGSMGDYPLLINGSRAGTGSDGTEMIAVTGYNSDGALNGVVVARDSSAKTLTDLAGGSISASVGSAGHGTLVQALEKAGIDPTNGVRVENQDPSVGASALKAGSVDAVAQFVAWPGLLAYQDDARLVYDGGELDTPTLHGTVVRKEYAADNPGVVKAFLRAQIEATDFLHRHPLQAATIVAKQTGLPAEVVYLYNGAGGISTFDPTIKPSQVTALRHDVPFLSSIGVLSDKLDVGAFVDDSLLRSVYGSGYDAQRRSLANPAAITGRDRACGRRVTDAATAGEVWVKGEDATRPTADAGCLLRNVLAAEDDGKTVRAAYLPDAVTGTRWFADKMIWFRTGTGYAAVATEQAAASYADAHPAATRLSWRQALDSVGGAA
ncbi:MAG: ABC transporter substrate-binding protein [Nocardioides sp.]|uniref:ABC transporter substrate-binding protein n=1 Tax=Nocardioides sp. TaxID=35761 RepID=UPI0039E2EFDF